MLNQNTYKKMTNLLKQGILFLVIFTPFAQGAVIDSENNYLSKKQRSKIYKVIGYIFKDKSLLDTAFIHSGSGNERFEAFEAIGDRCITAIVADSIDVSQETSAADIHEKIKSKTTNEYFADRYKALGLNQFLKTDSTSDQDTVYGNAMEALVGAIREDYYAQYPHLKGQGRVFKVLAKVVKKLIL